MIWNGCPLKLIHIPFLISEVLAIMVLFAPNIVLIEGDAIEVNNAFQGVVHLCRIRIRALYSY